MFTHRLGFRTLGNRRAAIVAVGQCIGLDLFLDQSVQLALGGQQRLQLIALFGQFVLLTADLELFQLRQMAKFQFEDGFGLSV
ncbi:hypothetical protein D3C79_558990 [compost metagenome]